MLRSSWAVWAVAIVVVALVGCECNSGLPAFARGGDVDAGNDAGGDAESRADGGVAD